MAETGANSVERLKAIMDVFKQGIAEGTNQQDAWISVRFDGRFAFWFA